MRTFTSYLDGTQTIIADVFRDERGSFSEVFNVEKVAPLFPTGIKQVSQSSSRSNVFRGVHFQYDKPMAKLMRVTRGAAIVWNVDLRPLSPTFGQTEMLFLSAQNRLMSYAPAWCGRAFLALKDDTHVEYFHDEVFNPSTSETILSRTVEDIQLHLTDSVIMSVKDKENGFTLYEWQEYAIKNGIFTDNGSQKTINVRDFGVIP